MDKTEGEVLGEMADDMGKQPVMTVMWAFYYILLSFSSSF